MVLSSRGLVKSACYFRATLPCSHVSAASYQILSQTKLLFTAGFMWALMGKQLGASQLSALVMLMAGSVLVTSGGSGGVGTMRDLYGGGLTVAGAALAALPNVYYEKVRLGTAAYVCA